MTRTKIMQKIVSLMFEIDTYKEARMYKKVEELRQRIEILEYSLQLCKDDLTAS